MNEYFHTFLNWYFFLHHFERERPKYTTIMVPLKTNGTKLRFATLENLFLKTYDGFSMAAIFLLSLFVS